MQEKNDQIAAHMAALKLLSTEKGEFPSIPSCKLAGGGGGGGCSLIGRRWWLLSGGCSLTGRYWRWWLLLLSQWPLVVVVVVAALPLAGVAGAAAGCFSHWTVVVVHSPPTPSRTDSWKREIQEAHEANYTKVRPCEH